MADKNTDSDKVKYLKSLLGKVSQATLGFGNDKETADSVEPTGSPIDLVAGGVGSKIGGALAKDAGAVVGNEIGSIGSNVNPSMSRTAPIMESQAPQVGSPIAQEAAAKEQMNALAPSANMTDIAKAQQQYTRSIDQADRYKQQLAAARAAGLKKLSGS
jgi:hypothetical protein